MGILLWDMLMNDLIQATQSKQGVYRSHEKQDFDGLLVPKKRHQVCKKLNCNHGPGQ